MRRSFSLAAILAWTMLQVPVVACQTECCASTTAVFLMSAHACHDGACDDREPEAKVGCLGCQSASCSGISAESALDDAYGSSRPEVSETGTPKTGAHVLIQCESTASGSGTVAMPATFVAIALWQALPAPTVAPWHRANAAIDEGPPTSADPVSNSDCLLV